MYHLFLLQKEYQSSILCRTLYLFWQENMQLTIVWVISSAIVCLFPRKFASSYVFFQSYCYCFHRILAVIRSCNGTVHFSDVKSISHPFLPTHFLSAYSRTPVTVNPTFYQSIYYFQNSIDYIEIRAATWSSYVAEEKCFSGYLVVWSSYLFLITTFW